MCKSDAEGFAFVAMLVGFAFISDASLRFLDETGCKYRKIELGPEWFHGLFD